MTVARLPGHPVRREHHLRPCRRGHRGRRVAGRRRDRDDHGALDEEGRRDHVRTSCAATWPRHSKRAPSPCSSLAFLAVGREGVETALFMVGYAEAETAWPLIGLVVGVLDRRGDRLRHVRGRRADQPGEVLHLHRRVPDRRRRRHPVLRHRRAADGRLAARPHQPGLRHQLLVRLVVLVRRGHPGRLQRHADADRAAVRRLAGLPRHRAGVVPAPDRRPAKPRALLRPRTPPSTKLRFDSRRIGAPHPHPKGPPRERLSPDREDRAWPRRPRCSRASRWPLHRQGGASLRAGSGDERARADHGERLRHRRASCRAPRAAPARTPSSSPTTAPRSPSSTSTARATG